MAEADLSMTLRPNEAMFSQRRVRLRAIRKKEEALDALKKAHAAGFHDSNSAPHDPDIAALVRHPEFDKLFPEKSEQ